MIRYNRRIYYYNGEYENFHEALARAKKMLMQRKARRYKILRRVFGGKSYFELWFDVPTRLY